MYGAPAAVHVNSLIRPNTQQTTASVWTDRTVQTLALCATKVKDITPHTIELSHHYNRGGEGRGGEGKTCGTC